MKGLVSELRILAVLTAMLGSGSLTAQENEPLRTRNLAPMVAVFGLPTWETAAAPGVGELTVVHEMASHFRLSARADEQLIVDGETWRTSFLYKRGFGDGWTFGIEVPFVRQWGGVLDNLIDGWHAAFNLPEGNRNRVANDRLDFRYVVNDEMQFALDRSQTGPGDVQVSMAREFGKGTLLRVVAKLPTGDEGVFAGSGSADLAVTLLRRGDTTWRSRSIGYYWGLGVIRVGEPGFLSDRNEDWAALGVFGAGWRPFERIGLKAQLDFHSRFYESTLDELGKDSIQASIGGWWAIDDRRRLSFAINEDLIVRTAPDVSLHVDFSWSF